MLRFLNANRKCEFLTLKKSVFAGIGLGGFLAGQLKTSLDISLPKVFCIMGTSIGVLAVSARILYQLFALPSESKLINNHEKIHQNHTTKAVGYQSEKTRI